MTNSWMARTLLAGALAALLASCGGGGGSSCSRPPSFSSGPPPTASVDQRYTYFVDASYACEKWFILFPIIPIEGVCHGFSAITLPPGASADAGGVMWTPSPNSANTNVQFEIATGTDSCGDRAFQSWTVHVNPSAIGSFSAAQAYVTPGESTMLTATFRGSGQIVGRGAITSGIPVSTGAIDVGKTFTLVVTDGLGAEWRRSLTVNVLPIVTDTNPMYGETQVPVNRVLTAKFNKVMDAKTINSTTFLLRDGGSSPVAGTVGYANGVATFTPVYPLAGVTSYTATITAGTRDSSNVPLATDYAWTFTTGVPDFTSPIVASTFPVDGGSIAPENAHVLVTFSESIDPNSVDASSFILRDSNLRLVLGSLSVGDSGTTAEFRPAGPLSPESTYTATVTTGIKDLAENSLAGDYSWTVNTLPLAWQPTSTTNAPSGRADHTAIWTGSEMIIWGGWDGSSLLNSGAKYDPAADVWTPVSQIGAPSARINHTAVWTGTEMIIWGGLDTTGRVMSGGRYNPITDSWTPISTSGAPTARYGHTAVWTGSEMIVWGGYNGEPGNLATSWPNSGAAYNPRTDTWRPIATTGAPSGRWIHTSVWTGSEMIVWGGSSGAFGGFQNSGGRYNPGTDTWAPTSMLGVPSARYEHTAVWSGAEMIVWGGSNEASGGLYDPVTDSWAQISDVGKPNIMSNHTAVWTGTAMIVWGLDFYGGSYDPKNDVWSKLAYLDAPSGRARHTAIWTGSRMIVWGGTTLTIDPPLFNTGGTYRP